eukprot:scaffold9537_cov140-Isochrysis_galbana.AAC.2
MVSYLQQPGLTDPRSACLRWLSCPETSRRPPSSSLGCSGTHLPDHHAPRLLHAMSTNRTGPDRAHSLSCRRGQEVVAIVKLNTECRG